MKNKLIILMTGLLFSCASAEQQKTVTVGKVAGSVDFRIIGSYGQLSDPQQALDTDVAIPLDGVPTPLSVILNQVGVNSNVSIDITEIGKDFSLEIIGTGIQNSDVYTVKTAKETITVGEK